MSDPTNAAPRAQLFCPSELRDLRRWLRWTLKLNAQGKWTKVPDCSTRDPSKWRTFDEAVAEGPVDEKQGVGFVFTGGVDLDGGRVHVFDLDGCRDPATGAIEPWAYDLHVSSGQGLTLVSPSGSGLHAWRIVANPPAGLAHAKVKLPHALAPNVPATKSVELQVFGYGVPQFVTWSGIALPGNVALGRLLDLRMLERFGIRETERADAAGRLPVGKGQSPTLAEVEARVLASAGKALIDGNWRGELGETERDKSASAAYYRLVQHTMRAARGHGSVALQYLLGTAWGCGDIEESADPSKYGRRSWIVKELARVEHKAPTPSTAAFGDFDFDAWEPPATPTPKATKSPPSALLGTAAELLAETADDLCLVYGVLPRRGLAQFFGDPGCGKTPFALSLAVHVAGGLPTWFGHELDRHGPVVYMIGEDRAGIRNRLRVELDQHKLPESLPFYWTKRPGNLTSAEDAAAWIVAVKAVSPTGCALLIVDTQSRNFGPGDENGTEDMAQFVSHCQTIADRLDCCVLLNHHTGHGDKSRGRGSSVMAGALDAAYEVKRTGKWAVTATATKSKNWADPEPLRGALVVGTVGTDRKGRPMTAVGLRDTPPTPGEAFTPLDGDDPVNLLLMAVDDAAGKPTSQATLATALGTGRGTVLQGAIGRAVELGLLEVRGGGKGLRNTSYHLTEQGFANLREARAQVAEKRLCELLD